MKREAIVKTIFRKALLAADPALALKEHLPHIMSAYEKGKFNSLQVVAFGKAACQMVKTIEHPLSVFVTKGIVITKYGHCTYHPARKIALFEAGHPLPDRNGLKATRKVMNMIRKAGEKTLILCLISGGGSSLLVSPYEGISLEEKAITTELLLRSGADIRELNTIRKHISGIKGGRLAELAYPARVLSLIVSDVIGDRLDVIASGPTAPDTSTYKKALSILKKYSLISRVPTSVLELLLKGAASMIPETPKKGSSAFRHVRNRIIASNRQALLAAWNEAAAMGLHAEIAPDPVVGEARLAGKMLAQKAIEVQRTLRKAENIKGKVCLISGGETTVTVRGNGFGGRNTELALAFAMEIEGIDRITLLSAGTDGTDGPTDAAGAIVDGQTIKGAKAMGMEPLSYLMNNNSYAFFRKRGGLLITGPTGTNVMDVQIILIDS